MHIRPLFVVRSCEENYGSLMAANAIKIFNGQLLLVMRISLSDLPSAMQYYMHDIHADDTIVSYSWFC